MYVVCNMLKKREKNANSNFPWWPSFHFCKWNLLIEVDSVLLAGIRGRSHTTSVGRWSKIVHFFCQRLYHRKCQRMGIGGKTTKNLVNVVCERPLVLWAADAKMSILSFARRRRRVSALEAQQFLHNCSIVFLKLYVKFLLLKVPKFVVSIQERFIIKSPTVVKII